MFHSDLPDRTKVDRVVPKNSFDEYTNTKQKKQISELINKIRWTHKLSQDTINLGYEEISEIEIFQIDLKKKVYIPDLLKIIDRSIPYHIVFILYYHEDFYISTSKKHSNPQNENISVIDWTFSSEWYSSKAHNVEIELHKSIDYVYKSICIQLVGENSRINRSLNDTIDNLSEKSELTKNISKLKSRIKSSRQFNEKVRLNIELKNLEKRLKELEK